MLRRMSYLILPVLLCKIAVAAAEIPQPEWGVGRSWQVRCPILAYSPYGGDRDTGKSYTLTFTVLRKERIGKSECWAVRIDTGGDFEADPRTLYVYYRTNDLSLMTEPYTTDLFLGKDGAPIYKERIACPDLSINSYLIEMPIFPLVPGRDGSRLIYDAGKDALGQPDPKKDTILTMKSVTHVEAAPEKGQGAVKVTLKWIDTYSKTGPRSRDYEQQIWIPGKPWWSSAKTPHSIAERSLISEGAPK